MTEPAKTLFDPQSHRKRLHHFDIPGHAHELTFSCYERRPLLTIHDEHCKILSKCIDRACERHHFDLVAFVFMPEHVHLVVWPFDPDTKISALLYAIKQPSSYRIKAHLAKRDPETIEQLTIRDRPGRMTFRFWQEGGGYDRNIKSPRSLQASVEYIHNNPTRRGLCNSVDEWKWSSWEFYHEPNAQRNPDLPTVRGFPD